MRRLGPSPPAGLGRARLPRRRRPRRSRGWRVAARRPWVGFARQRRGKKRGRWRQLRGRWRRLPCAGSLPGAARRGRRGRGAQSARCAKYNTLTLKPNPETKSKRDPETKLSPDETSGRVESARGALSIHTFRLPRFPPPPAGEELAAALKKMVHEAHGEGCVPTHFLPIGAIPRTYNSKPMRQVSRIEKYSTSWRKRRWWW